MKYSIIILFLIASCGYGQYPQLHYLPKMTVQQFRPVRIVKDSGSHWFSKPGNDTIFVTLKTYIGDSLVYFVAPYVDTVPTTLLPMQSSEMNFDYWKQYLFFKHESDKQKDIIKKQRNPSYKVYDRLMDSVVRYKLLIDHLKDK